MSNPFDDAKQFIADTHHTLTELDARLRGAGANKQITDALYRVLLAIENIPEFNDDGEVLA